MSSASAAEWNAERCSQLSLDFDANHMCRDFVCPASGNSTAEWGRGVRSGKYGFPVAQQIDQQSDLSAKGEDEFGTYEALCRGELPAHLRSRRAQQLHCEFDARGDPRLLLSPARVELLCVEPRVELLHDVVSDVEIAHLKRLALPLVCACDGPDILVPVPEAYIYSLHVHVHLRGHVLAARALGSVHGARLRPVGTRGLPHQQDGVADERSRERPGGAAAQRPHQRAHWPLTRERRAASGAVPHTHTYITFTKKAV